MLSERDRLVEALRDALLKEWNYNHAEHCTNQVPHPPVRCLWPMPDVLAIPLMFPNAVPGTPREGRDRSGRPRA
jgi:hypothetical protein